MGLTVPSPGELVAPGAWRTVDFVSDLHLDADHPDTVAAFSRYLDTTPADAVFLLGDLFEVWVGDDALQEPGSFEAKGCALLRRAASRRALYFMHGNRDFLVGGGFTAATGIPVLEDPTVLVFAGRRWLLSHGDALCLDDVDYQRFRAVARDPQWQAQVLARPLADRRAQGRSVRAESEARKQSGSGFYGDVDTPAALAWLAAADACALIHGHTHLPADHVLRGAAPGGDALPALTRHVLTDWDLDSPAPRAGVLRLTAQGLERVALVPT
ncbi:UDP-2,3-diacylglucosamine diphosphatase [Acidovorax sp. GBBC 3334]|uniref:UDP-2,3-diacylglucosamine diphosphatase n=1 Tax=Acidovorax sp. GBBC 3334 TaxID=2940496 RepID=UPI0023022A4F|nr:UDP-2,3-diacylglucosamine diphosphatase [Acidovorax sp. GBBC 3334]MDA8455305.1 UDP-2,3-diacylglucosamine diphosphatase [Acidovorax sp. GBBC 3334]